MRADNVGTPATQAQWNFIHKEGRNLRTSLESVTAVFSPSCISHTVLTKPFWTGVMVEGVSLPDALQCWVEQPMVGETMQGEEEDRETGDRMFLQQNYLDRTQHVNDYLRPMQADSPQESFKRLNSNLVKSIDRYQSNSMGHRTKKLRHKPNIVHNRTKKRNKQKRKRNKRRCKYGDTLESRIQCAKEENEARKRLRMLGVSTEEVERSNRDLVRSIERGTSPELERQRRRRRRKRQRRVSSEHKLTKDQRRQLRREEKRRLKKELRRRQRLQSSSRQGRRLRSSRLDFSQISSHLSRQRHRLSTRSIRTTSTSSSSVSSQCKTKHVDQCSWPQCNRSCPKLHNPLTGEIQLGPLNYS